jgi:hypothetical protein
MRTRSTAGQASTEYVAIVALVAVVFSALAGVLVAAPDLRGSLVATIRTGLCIVGGDICRTADAKARGLDPCIVQDEDHRRRTGATVAFVRVGGTQQYAIERRSDGTYRVSAGDGQDGGLTAGLGFALGGGVHVGVDGTAAVTFTGGKSWELPDEAALDSFLARVQSRYDLGKDMTEFMRLVPPPAERYASAVGDATGELAAELASKKHSTKPLGEEAGLRTAIGTRTGGGGKVWYLEAGAELSGALGDVVPALGGKGGVLVEWRTGDRPSVTLRKAARQGTRTTETVVRLPLARDDDLLSASRSTLALLSGPTAKLAGRDFAQRVRARATVEHDVYEEQTHADGWNYGARLGIAVGAERGRTVTTRRLVDATVEGPGGTTAKRIDCLGPGAA